MKINKEIMEMVQRYKINIEDPEVNEIVLTIIEDNKDDIDAIDSILINLNDCLNPHKIGDKIKGFTIIEVINEDWYVEYIGFKRNRFYLLGHDMHVWHKEKTYKSLMNLIEN